MKRLILLISLMALVSTQIHGCGAASTPTDSDALQVPERSPKKRIVKKRDVRFIEDEQLKGLKMVLRELGDLPDEGISEKLIAQGKPISGERTSKLLARLDKIEYEQADRLDFAVRKGSVPPPRTGDTVDVAFPPKDTLVLPEMGEPGKLEVLRFAPEGEVSLAPHLSIAFSRPMIAVTSQEEASKIVPARLTPEPDGDWRWLGTRVLMFKPDVRFPMATDYKIEIPAGTKSSTGDKLAKATTFEFKTPAPAVVNRHPVRGPHGLEPVIFIEFDQKIDQVKMLSHIIVDGPQAKLRMATKEEIAQDDQVRSMVMNAKEDRWIALKAAKPLPKATSFTVRIKKGAPSAEGPKTTPGDQVFRFYTYNPLEISRHHCNWNSECRPTSDFRIQFNNSLDSEKFDPESISVEPVIAGMNIQQWGRSLTISGLKQGRTRYTVTIPSSVRDEYGQKLEENQVLKFDVGSANKTLFGPKKSMVTLDPSGPKSLAIHSINHKKLNVQINKVTPGDWIKWQQWMRDYRYNDVNPGPLPGKRVHKKNVKVKGEADRLTQTMVDFTKHLKQGYGQFIVRVEPRPQPKDRWSRQEVLVWVQITDLGVSAFVDDQQLVAWTTRLSDGSPVEGALAILSPGEEITGKSDGYGLAKLRLSDNSDDSRYLVAKHGNDAAILPSSNNWYGSDGWRRVLKSDSVRWYTFDDRGMYRPGENARIKGWLRRFEAGVGGDIAALKNNPGTVSWKLYGSRGNELSKGDVDVSKLGGFDISLDLPKEMNLGQARVEFRVSGIAETNGYHNHQIRVEEFRRPEFEVKATAEPAPYLLGEEVQVDSSANYYAGGGLPNAQVTWRVYANGGSYIPPNRGDYSFGVWSPWWNPSRGSGGGKTESLSGKTDAAGEHHLGIHFESMNPPRPMSVRAEATVMDVNRQAWTATSNMLVHPANLYVGLKPERSFVGRDEMLKIDALVVDLEGEIVEGVESTITLAKIEYSWKKGSWGERERDPQTCKITSKGEASTCEFMPKLGGRYKVKAVIRDSNGRKNETELRIWVAGQDKPPARDVEQEKVVLVPEKQIYKPGEIAKFLVQAPFYPAQGKLTIRRSGLERIEHFDLPEPSTTLEVPIIEKHIPGVTVQVDLMGSAPRTDDDGNIRDDLPRRVAFASGSLTFKVSTASRELEVKAKPREDTLDPGGNTVIDLEIKDSKGAPVVGAELVVLAADESVLALTGYKLPDPIELFYSARGAGVSDYHTRHQVLLSDPSKLADMVNSNTVEAPMAAPAPVMLRSSKSMAKRSKKKGALKDLMGSSAEKSAGFSPAVAELSEMKEDESDDSPMDSTPIKMRTDFSALALFAPKVTTDENGHAQVPLKLPDSLTRYRIMVVAVSGENKFGTGESNVTARLPLMVRPSAPRFLNFGDKFQLPVVIQNQTDEQMTVDVAVRGTNVTLAPTLEQADPANQDFQIASYGQKIIVPANDRVEVRFPAAAQMAGTARFQVVAASGKRSDAADFELPVWTPATSEAFATYGEVDKGSVVQPVRTPGKVWPQFGGLEITTSSTQLQALTDAVLYIVSYPFDCNEQISSRILSIAALRDVLSAFETEGLPEPKDIENSVRKDLKRLAKRQNYNGGFAFWRRGDKDWPYLTIHVANAMARARDKGYKVPDRMWDRVGYYLERIERHIPHWYSQESKWSIRAYALNVQNLMGKNQLKKAQKLLKEATVEKLPMEAKGWLLPVFFKGKATEELKTILHNLNNKVTETAAGAHFVTGYSDGAHVLLHSNRRVDGIILESLIEVDQSNDLIPKLVRGLLDHRVKGRWSNTQENTFVLLALDRYFNVFEKITPDFVARAWLGEHFAGEHTFKGRTTERAQIDIPMNYLARTDGDQPLVLQKDGKGRMYYRIGMRYAPRSLELKPVDYGFAVERVYESVDDPKDVSRDKNGAWHFRAGARIRVRLTMAAVMRRYHVALVDPMPAGLEAINPELAVSGTVPEDSDSKSSKSRYWWWYRPWYEHQNMRDERTEAFTSLLWEGVHTYTYVARATTPGHFIVPPTKAEEMYHPETFGRSGTDRVIIE